MFNDVIVTLKSQMERYKQLIRYATSKSEIKGIEEKIEELNDRICYFEQLH